MTSDSSGFESTSDYDDVESAGVESVGDETVGEFSVDDETQLQPEDTLVDRGVEDVLDEGIVPPDHPVGLDAFGTTPAEQAQGETLDMRLAQEMDDPAAHVAYGLEPDELPAEPEVDDVEAGVARAGRLVGDDDGTGVSDDTVATDVGIAGGAATAEEAAMHVVDLDGAQGLTDEGGSPEVER